MPGLDGLQQLLSAPNKDFVAQVFQTAYASRATGVPDDIAAKAAEAMSLDAAAASQMFASIVTLINMVLFESVTTKEGLMRLLPESLHQKLQNLIVGVVAANLSHWREQAVNSQLSLPKLKDFEWQIDIKTASDQLARMSLPTAIVQMKIQEIPTHTNEMPNLKHVVFEVNKETLDTMLDGLGKIRDQLASVADSGQ